MNLIISIREAIQAVQAKQRYDKLHAEGKTDQAKAVWYLQTRNISNRR